MPLSGVHVVDMSRFLPGPQCAALLGDYGAQVTRIETPSHAASRDRAQGIEQLSGQDRDRAIATDLSGRNKNRRLINFFKDEGREGLVQLIRSADVLIHDYRLTTLQAAGLSHDGLRSLNPRLILAAISSTGETGPRAGAPGHDPVAQALAGTVARSAPKPHLLGFPAADILTASNTALAILVALRRRDATGEGATLDAAMSDSALHLNASVFARQQRTQQEPPLDFPMGDNAVFAVQDGHVVATNMERPYWDRFCTAIERPDLSPLFTGNRDYVLDELAAIYRTKTRAQWDAFARAHDLQIAPVLSPAEALEEPHHHARCALRRDPITGVVILGRPVRIAELDQIPIAPAKAAEPEGAL
mgnify:CR=1 FL=1